MARAVSVGATIQECSPFVILAHVGSHHLRFGTLVPRGYRHEGSSELLVRQVWPGDLVTVVLDPPPSETSAGGEKVSPAGSAPPLEDRSAMSELPQGRVVLQHLATDLVVEECAAPVAPVRHAGSRPAQSASAEREQAQGLRPRPCPCASAPQGSIAHTLGAIARAEAPEAAAKQPTAAFASATAATARRERAQG